MGCTLQLHMKHPLWDYLVIFIDDKPVTHVGCTSKPWITQWLPGISWKCSRIRPGDRGASADMAYSAIIWEYDHVADNKDKTHESMNNPWIAAKTSSIMIQSWFNHDSYSWFIFIISNSRRFLSLLLPSAAGDAALVDPVDGSARRCGRQCLQPSAPSACEFS